MRPAASVGEHRSAEGAIVQRSGLSRAHTMETVSAAGSTWGQRAVSVLSFVFRTQSRAVSVLSLLGAALIFQRRENQRLIAQINERPVERSREPLRLAGNNRGDASSTRRGNPTRRARRSCQGCGARGLARRSSQEKIPGKPPTSERERAKSLSFVARLIRYRSRRSTSLIDVDPQGSTRHSRARGHNNRSAVGANLFTLIQTSPGSRRIPATL